MIALLRQFFWVVLWRRFFNRKKYLQRCFKDERTNNLYIQIILADILERLKAKKVSGESIEDSRIYAIEKELANF